MLHLLEPSIAAIMLLVTIVAVANVLRASHSYVPLTQPLELDAGSQYFALQKAVAVRVSYGDRIAKVCGDIYYCEKTLLHRCSNLT